MNMKMIASCVYLALVYWLASGYSLLHLLFFPTLGAFSFLFLSKSFDRKELLRIIMGACIASSLGCLFYYISASAFSLLAVSLIAMGLTKLCNWNAPPIISVTLIPFFGHPQTLWLVPLCTLCALSGLFVVFWLVELAATPFSTLPDKRRQIEH